MTDLGSVSSGKKVPGAYYKKMTSSNPYGTEAPSSIYQLAKATNAVIGPVAQSTGTLTGSFDETGSATKSFEPELNEIAIIE